MALPLLPAAGVEAVAEAGDPVTVALAVSTGLGGVPPDWNVSLEVLPLLAGVEDKRTQHENREGAPTLVLKGVVIMGGIDVKN